MTDTREEIIEAGWAAYDRTVSVRIHAEAIDSMNGMMGPESAKARWEQRKARASLEHAIGEASPLERYRERIAELEAVVLDLSEVELVERYRAALEEIQRQLHQRGGRSAVAWEIAERALREVGDA